MRLSVGDCLGPYEVVDTLGVGGMGEVYRARDRRLSREVAVKIMPADLAADPDRLSRFEREARLLAALTDPHIAAIYDVEETDGIRALVLELVEGETLAERIARGRVPFDETVVLARQIAEALGAAHAVGIVHRDLKPANVKVTSDGEVKILDFGLAKEVTPQDAVLQADSPTVTSAATRVGLVLGTVAYMSPEQARGLPIDKRTDIWAFGCLLFEMLAGVPAFAGETASDVLVAVLQAEPAWNRLPRGTPDSIVGLLRRCLEKDVRRRFHDIADVTIILEDLSVSGLQSRRAHTRWHPLMVASVLLAAVLLGSLLAMLVQRPRVGVTPEPLTFRITAPAGVQLPQNPQSALSPDGRRLVFQAGPPGAVQLWLHTLADGSSVPLEGTSGGIFPFWSHDGRSIGFFAAGKLKILDASGGAAPVSLCDVGIGRGGTWNAQNDIVYANVDGPLQRIPATGGTSVAITRIDASRGEVSHIRPQFLPDGRHVLYTSAGKGRELRVAALDDPSADVSLGVDAVGAYSSGHLIMERRGGLVAQAFDLSTLRLSGTPFTVSHRAGSGAGLSLLMPFSVSETGTLTYATSIPAVSQLTWFDRTGSILGTVGEPADYGFAALSHDQTRIAVTRPGNDSSDGSIWVIQVSDGSASRVTFGPEDDTLVRWSSDDRRLIFSAQRSGPYNVLAQIAADGTGQPDLLIDPQVGNWLNDVSRDGRFVLYAADSKATSGDLWSLPLDGVSKPFPVVNTQAYEGGGAFAPDTKWVAYTSTMTGRPQIYVRSFPAGAHSRQISTGGGLNPIWREAGGELYFVTPDQYLMAAKFPGGSIAATPTITKLFRLPVPLAATGRWQQYTANRDGTRFLAIVPSAERSASTITVVENWAALGRGK